MRTGSTLATILVAFLVLAAFGPVAAQEASPAAEMTPRTGLETAQPPPEGWGGVRTGAAVLDGPA